MRKFLIVAAFVAFTFDARPGYAQAVVKEGVRVRAEAPGAPRLTGVVRSVTPDSLVLFVEPAGTPHGIARSSISRIEVSHGRSAWAGAKKGALWGTGIFGGLGVLFAVLVASDDSDTGNGPEPAAYAAVAIAEGAGIGALIGAFVKSEKWETVTLQPVAGTGGVGFRLGLR